MMNLPAIEGITWLAPHLLPHPVFDHLPPPKILGGRNADMPSSRVRRVGEGA